MGAGVRPAGAGAGRRRVSTPSWAGPGPRARCTDAPLPHLPAPHPPRHPTPHLERARRLFHALERVARLYLHPLALQRLQHAPREQVPSQRRAHHRLVQQVAVVHRADCVAWERGGGGGGGGKGRASGAGGTRAGRQAGSRVLEADTTRCMRRPSLAARTRAGAATARTLCSPQLPRDTRAPPVTFVGRDRRRIPARWLTP